MERDVARHEGAIGTDRMLCPGTGWEKRRGNTLGRAVGRCAGGDPTNDCKDRKKKSGAAAAGRQPRGVEFPRGLRVLLADDPAAKGAPTRRTCLAIDVRGSSRVGIPRAQRPLSHGGTARQRCRHASCSSISRTSTRGLGFVAQRAFLDTVSGWRFLPLNPNHNVTPSTLITASNSKTNHTSRRSSVPSIGLAAQISLLKTPPGQLSRLPALWGTFHHTWVHMR